MPGDPYLIQLNHYLAERLDHWTAPKKDASANAILRWQTNGGFAGRLGPPDLYYTAFALRALAVLDRLDSPATQAAARFIHSCAKPAVDNLIDLVSFAFIRRLTDQTPPDLWPDRDELLQVIADHRRPDGFAKSLPAKSASTYHTFLAVQAYDLLGKSIPDPDQLLPLLRARQRDDGGFAESHHASAGSVNPTAAAMSVAAASGRYDLPSLMRAVEFLICMQAPDGGWPAVSQAPSDLLSTFTALLTLDQSGMQDAVDLDAARNFTASCQLPDGAFAASPGDADGDVEYTFYGIACAAILRF